jgi:hypothetical protein
MAAFLPDGLRYFIASIAIVLHTLLDVETDSEKYIRVCYLGLFF